MLLGRVGPLVALGALGAFAALSSRTADAQGARDTASLIADLASSTVGDAQVVPLAERGEPAVAALLSFVADHSPAEARELARLPESDRAGLLRAEAVLARLGRIACTPLVQALAREQGGARRAALARALARAAATALAHPEGEDAARAGAESLARLLLPEARVTLVSEELLYSGHTTEPVPDPEALPRALGELAPVALPFVAPLLEHEDETTRELAARALANADARRDAAALVLGKALDRAPTLLERARLGRALAELGGDSSVLALEKALVRAEGAEVLGRVLDLEATRNPSVAPRALARNLERLEPSVRSRALDAMATCALPPPPPPKTRFLHDPFARRRSRDAREARQEARLGAVARLERDPSPRVRTAAARCLAALARPEDKTVAQSLAARVLAAFGSEGVLAVRAEVAHALLVLVPSEVLAERFRVELGRSLDLGPEPESAGLVLGDATLAAAPRHAPDAAARDRLVAALVSVVDGETPLDVPLLERAVRDGSLGPIERARAAAGLARAGREGVLALDEVRRDGDAIARCCAAAARASALPSEAALDLLEEAEALGRAPEPLLRRAAVGALAHSGGKSVQGFVQGLARNDPSAAVRLEGTRAIASVYGRAAAPTLAQALADGSPPVRRAAAIELERLAVPDQGVPGSLAAAIARARKLPDRELATEEERLLRSALDALGRESAPGLANPARAAGDPVERLVAIDELGRLGTDEATAILVTIVQEPKTTPEDRDAAARAIVRATKRDLADPMWEGLRPSAQK
jgi:hypothetical protein